MKEYNDDQHYVYPPAYPHAPFPPMPPAPHMQPVGGDAHRTMVVSSLGQGPVGPKGDPGEFEDYTEEQKAEIAEKVVLWANKSTEGVFVTTASSTQYVNIPIEGYTNYDMLFVDINGLDLIEGTDYEVLSNGTIKLTPAVQGAGNEIHFRALSYESTDSKYVTIAPTLADPIDWDPQYVYNEYTVVRHDNVAYISKQPVPAGIQIDNEDYWQVWANENAVLTQEIEDRKLDIEKAHVFNTVTDMKLSDTLSVGAICHTNGFHASGDGGAAWYLISDSGTANEMDVIACGDLFAHLIITEFYVTPEMFGAYGDSDNDDLQYIQRMFDACIDKEIHTFEFINGKVYKVSDTIVVNNRNITITNKGSNYYLPKLYSPLNSASILMLFKSTGITVENMNFGDASDRSEFIEGYQNIALSFDRRTDTAQTTDALSNIDSIVRNSRFSHFDLCCESYGRNINYNNCNFSESNNGVHFHNFSYGSNEIAAVRGWNVRNCSFHSMGAILNREIYQTIDEINSWCIQTDLDVATVIESCNITGNSVDGNSNTAFYKGLNGDVNINNNHIGRSGHATALLCNIYPSSSAGFCAISNNIVSSQAGNVYSNEFNYSAIYWHNVILQNTVRRVNIHNNSFFSTQRASIYAVGTTSDISISDNFIIDCAIDLINDFVHAVIDFSNNTNNYFFIKNNNVHVSSSGVSLTFLQLPTSSNYRENTVLFNTLINPSGSTSINNFLNASITASGNVGIDIMQPRSGNKTKKHLSITSSGITLTDVDENGQSTIVWTINA